MFGALPAAITYYWRMKMPEKDRYTALITKNAKQAAEDMAKVLQVHIEAEPEKLEKITERKNRCGLFNWEFACRHGLHLLGTTTTWFLLGIASYSNNLFQKDIYTAVGWLPPAQDMNAIHEVYKVARAQTLITLCGTVHGYWFTVAIPYHHWTKKHNRIAFLVMYFLSNFGPNSITMIVAADIFPARLRSTSHRISAAAGKAGATIGTIGFLFAAQSKDPKKTVEGYPTGIGVKNSLIMLGVINFVRMLFTFLLPESKGKSLEELSGENKDDERGDQAT